MTQTVSCAPGTDFNFGDSPYATITEDDRVDGSDTDDVFTTFGAGHDTIYGFGGDDTLDSGVGNDVLSGGAGSDVLTGGSGADVFLGLASEMDGDRIVDFGAGDTIRLLDFSGDVSVQSTAAGTVLQFDTDDDGSADGRLALTGDFTAARFAIVQRGEDTEITLAAGRATQDFDGDGTDDILWRHSNGKVAFWKMTDGAQSYRGLGAAGPEWTVQGTGDFDGDGTDDILWRHSNGKVAFWKMTDGAQSYRGLGAAGPDWTVQGTGDFDGDGTDDILWRHSNGRVALWEMTDGAQSYHAIAEVAADWMIA